MLEIDTSKYLTHNNLNSNIFTPQKNQIAFPSLLPSITFRQWHLTDKILQLTNNANVAKYASLIGSFPVMGKYGFQIPHAVMAAKYAVIFECKAPAPQTVAKWEKILVELKLLEIPRHMLFGGQNKSKLRVFTDKFWNMARSYCKEKLSYICPPSTLWRSPSTIIRKVQANPKDPNNNNIETPERAHVDIDREPERPHTAHAARVENIKKGKGEGEGRPRHILDGNHTTALKKHGSQKKPLPTLLAQIFHCIMTKSEVKDQLAGLMFFADVVRANRRGDETARRFFGHWPDLTQASKAWHINQLLGYMRATGGGMGIETLCPPPEKEHVLSDNELSEMISALCMQESYNGPLRVEFERLANLPFEEQSFEIDRLLNAS